jgi:hypothetical protein
MRLDLDEMNSNMVNKQAQMEHPNEQARLGLHDRLLRRAGNSLIALGCRLKKYSDFQSDLENSPTLWEEIT